MDASVCFPGALIYLLDLFCNCTHPQVRTQTAELFSKMTSDKLVGPKVSNKIKKKNPLVSSLCFIFHQLFSPICWLIGTVDADAFSTWCVYGCHAGQCRGSGAHIRGNAREPRTNLERQLKGESVHHRPRDDA